MARQGQSTNKLPQLHKLGDPALIPRGCHQGDPEAAFFHSKPQSASLWPPCGLPMLKTSLEKPRGRSQPPAVNLTYTREVTRNPRAGPGEEGKGRGDEVFLLPFATVRRVINGQQVWNRLYCQISIVARDS